MRVAVRFHGIVGDMIRPKIDSLELPEGATLADLVAAVSGKNTKNAAVLRQTHFFIDGQMVDRNASLVDGAVVTVMRPMSGG